MNKRLFLLIAFLSLVSLSGNAQPIIQNSFWGMKMGEKVDGSIIRNSIGARGELRGTTTRGAYTIYYINDIDFGGKTWKQVRIFTDSSKRLYMVRLENPYGSESACQKYYDDIRQILMEKYPLQQEKSETKSFERYSDGQCSVELEAQPSSGSLSYVVLWYFNESLYDSVVQAQKDEF